MLKVTVCAHRRCRPEKGYWALEIFSQPCERKKLRDTYTAEDGKMTRASELPISKGLGYEPFYDVFDRYRFRLWADLGFTLGFGSMVTELDPSAITDLRSVESELFHSRPDGIYQTGNVSLSTVFVSKMSPQSPKR